MDFKRIQWIFFFAFLLFDVIIASSLLVENRFIVTNNQSSRSSVILKEMKDIRTRHLRNFWSQRESLRQC